MRELTTDKWVYRKTQANNILAAKEGRIAKTILGFLTILSVPGSKNFGNRFLSQYSWIVSFI